MFKKVFVLFLSFIFLSSLMCACRRSQVKNKESTKNSTSITQITETDDTPEWKTAYLNLDGTGTQTADVKVNGRKSNAAVAFCDEGEIPPVHFKEIIFFNILKQEIINKKSFFVATLHRLQSKMRLQSNYYFNFAINYNCESLYLKKSGCRAKSAAGFF